MNYNHTHQPAPRDGAFSYPEENMTDNPENLRTRLEQSRNGLWYYEGSPEQHCELLAWVGEDVALRPVDGSPIFTCNGSFVWPVRDPK